MFKKEKLGIILILLIAAFLRFYNLMHDSPYFFNPDERNMASAITRFRLPTKLSEIPICLLKEFQISKLLKIKNCSLNPHFFAYGQFPLYLAYFSYFSIKSLSKNMPFFLQTINNQQSATLNSQIQQM